MIAYEELCGALARWREARGLTNGPSAHPPPPMEHPGERTVVAAAPMPVHEPPVEGRAAARATTGELDLDAMDLVDEELV